MSQNALYRHTVLTYQASIKTACKYLKDSIGFRLSVGLTRASNPGTASPLLGCPNAHLLKSKEGEPAAQMGGIGAVQQEGEKMVGLELHPLCTLFPRMSGADFEALKADISIHGLRQPIVLHDGMILDGGNRYRACREVGVVPDTIEFANGNPVAFVLSANLHRRHMTAGQQAAIVASAQDWAQAHGHGGDHKSAKSSANREHLKTAGKRAEQSRTSVATQRKADAVAKASPELALKVAHGEVSLGAAVNAVAPQLAPRKSKPSPEPEPPEEDRTAELCDTIRQLSEENDALRDGRAVAELPEEDRAGTAEIIASLRAHVKTLEAELSAVKSVRDGLQQENHQLKKQLAMQRKEIAKLTK